MLNAAALAPLCYTAAMAYLVLESPVGPLTVFAEDGAIVALEFGRAPKRRHAPAGENGPLLKEAAAQLAAYFAGTLERFDLPLAPSGTPFQKAVWRRMSQIPKGTVRTYGDLAEALHSAPRAVGQACGANPIPIIVPCHRVVGGAGRVGGYSGGDGAKTKRFLLAHERALLPL